MSSSLPWLGIATKSYKSQGIGLYMILKKVKKGHYILNYMLFFISIVFFNLRLEYA